MLILNPMQCNAFFNDKCKKRKVVKFQINIKAFSSPSFYYYIKIHLFGKKRRVKERYDRMESGTSFSL